MYIGRVTEKDNYVKYKMVQLLPVLLKGVVGLHLSLH